VEIAVLETARGGIVKRGLGYDWADVAILTNIQPDHIGQDGIETVEDILHIKSLVAERVREGGCLILNADDELLARLAEEPAIKKVSKQIVYFSLRPNHILLRKHVLAGGTAYTVKSGWIVEISPDGEFRLGDVGEIPATINGMAEFNVANSLAAIAACRAQGLTAEQIFAALTKFHNTEHNQGRLNLYKANGGYVLVDYGHNPEAIKSVCRMAANWDNGIRRVTGIVTAPGDRDNDLVEQVGQVAAQGFNRIVIREDADLRGRAKGEIAQLLNETIKNEAPELDCQIILNEDEALRREITRLREGDVVVCFYEDFEVIRKILEKCDAEPVHEIERTVAGFAGKARYASPLKIA
jgi:cyanophycin synthetase